MEYKKECYGKNCKKNIKCDDCSEIKCKKCISIFCHEIEIKLCNKCSKIYIESHKECEKCKEKFPEHLYTLCQMCNKVMCIKCTKSCEICKEYTIINVCKYCFNKGILLCNKCWNINNKEKEHYKYYMGNEGYNQAKEDFEILIKNRVIYHHEHC